MKLVDLHGNPLADAEFVLINEQYFSVPFASIKLVDTRETVIPGLRTRDAAVKEKYLSQKNVFPIKALIEDGDGLSDETWWCFEPRITSRRVDGSIWGSDS